MLPGMVFTIEPVVFQDLKNRGVEGWTDGTVVTCDEGRSSQFEHTILVTKDGHEILTI
jgi:methionyl aminopeptidase